VLSLLAAGVLMAQKPDPNLHVEGNKLVKNAKVVRLQGANVPSLEWSNTGEKVYRSCRVLLEDWNANCIRLPLSQDRWFGKAEGQADKGEDYRATVDELVDFTDNRNGYLVLDLHWSDAGEWGKNIGQHNMPDMNSVEFWKEVAKRYRKRPHVLFDLYNEPHDVDWKTWRDGGDVKEGALSYKTPGFTALVETVRKAGAKNVLVVGGLDWAYDLTGVTGSFALADPNVMYASHIYPWKTEWEAKVGVAADKFPVLIGEVGCEPDGKNEDPATWAPKVLDFIDKRSLSWTAWTFHPTATPRMIQDWIYTPTPYWGEPVLKRLKARKP